MLAAVRASHEHLDLEVLDALTRGADELPAVIGELNSRPTSHDQPPLAGWVVVSTCNRLEIYLDAHRFHDGVELVIDAVVRTSGRDRDLVSLCFDAAMDAPVARHLDEVTSGLRSIVLGEAEIAGQMRALYESARRGGWTTSLLHDLFQHAFRCAKQVATQAPVGAAGRSGAAVALDRAGTVLGGFEGRSALVVGTGAYARLSVAELLRRGAGPIRVHSPSGRALGFAQRHGLEAVAPEELDAALADADLVVACSGRGTSLFPEQFLTAGRTVVLDLALHSDLHPLVRHLKGITVLDLTDLQVAADAADPSLVLARRIVEDSVEAFRVQQEVRRIDPAMAALRREVADTADAEIDRMRRETDPEIAEQLERSIRRILAKVMHSPAERARRLAQDGYADAYVDAFHTIFGIDISGGDATDQRAVHGAEEPEAQRGWMRVDQTVPTRSIAELAHLALQDDTAPAGCPMGGTDAGGASGAAGASDALARELEPAAASRSTVSAAASTSA
ncbi:glutamyl-tRNA reductase [Brachybacterium sp. DNPG3]